MTETLRIFDEHKNVIGRADRDEVHKKGYWHETFHCWFVEKIEGVDFIYLQKRSAEKKDFPELLDITAAGHILSDETVTDGIREVKEELGIEVEFEDLISFGIIEDTIVSGKFADREFAHVFLYRKGAADEFSLQREEVSGIFKARFSDFEDLCAGKKQTIEVEGFTVDDFGARSERSTIVSLDHFVPHETNYLNRVAELIAGNLK